MNTTTQPVSLKVSRLIKAPRERVFAAWTTPADVMHWLGSNNCKVVTAKIDPRVGGEYSFAVKSDDHGDTCVSGVFREVNPPSRLVFSWKIGGCTPSAAGIDTQVTVNLTEQQGGTMVQITHEGFPDTEVRDGHVRGWTDSLAKLEKLV